MTDTTTAEEPLTVEALLEGLRKCREEIVAGKDASTRGKALIRQARDAGLVGDDASVKVPELAEAFGVSPGMVYQYMAPALRDD